MRILALSLLLVSLPAIAQDSDTGLHPVQLDLTKKSDQVFRIIEEEMMGEANEWFEDGEFARVVQVCRLRYGLYPGNYDATTDLGWMLTNIEEDEQAIEVYRAYLTENKKDVDRGLPLATYFVIEKRFKDVIDVLEPIVGEKGQHANNYRLLARAYEKENRLKDAIETFKRMLKVFPDDMTAKANLNRLEKKLADS